MTVLLVVVAAGFAYSMGAHYTGACMGMPHALRAISARAALTVMAPLSLLGATFASHQVEHTVGHDLLAGAGLSVGGLVIVVGIAFGLTSAFNRLRIPTSTIQILVFTVVGAGLGAGLGVKWATIGTLAVIWATAPMAAAGLGYLLTKAMDRLPGVRLEAAVSDPSSAPVTSDPDAGTPARGDPVASAPGTPDAPVGGWLAGALVGVGALASFTMGSNDVANATGPLVGTHTFSPLTAGFIGGLGLAFGVLSSGRPLLKRVAFDIVTVDRPMATAAQLVQGAVVLAAVAFGFFTSMNQALIGAMTGAAAARSRHTVHVATLMGILRGWVVGPGTGVALAYGLTRIVAAATGVHTVVASA